MFSKPDTFPSLEKIRHIGIVRLSALGDVTLLLPIVRTLRQALPDTKISWVISRAVYPLLAGVEGVNFIVIDKPKTPLDYWRLRKQLRHEKFDVVLALQASLRANLIYPLMKAPIKIGFDNVRSRDLHGLFINRRISFTPQHLLDSFFSFIETLGVTERVLTWNLPIDDADKKWAKQQLPDGAGPVLIVNPTASKQDRNWLTARYADVISQAVKRWQARVVLTGGPTKHEKAIGHAIEKQLDVPVVNLIGKSTLKQLAALLSEADCVIAPDTGPAHIGVAVGTPVIGLYADVTPKMSGPYLQHDLIIDVYEEAVHAFLGKTVADIPWGRRIHHRDAMALITVERVMEKLAKVFDKA